MKKTMSRILALIMAMTMMMGAIGTVFAAGGYDPNKGSGSLRDDSDDSIVVTFVPDKGYTLDPAEGTTLKKNGEIAISISSKKVPEKKVPDTIEADQYYEFDYWAIKNKDGDFEEIDLDEYRFSRNTDVYAVMEDTWPVFNDMSQKRNDWYYQYVRDLSIAGVVSGTPAYDFLPKKNASWGESLVLIMLATGYDKQVPTAGHWASGYLTAALADGLLDESYAGLDLNAPITRLEFGQTTAKALGFDPSENKTPFVDCDDALIVSLVDAGIIAGTTNADGDRVYNPDNYITRMEMSTIIWQVNNYYANLEA